MSLGDEETARTREALKAGVAASVHDLIDVAQQLTEETQKDRKQTRVLSRFSAAAAFLALLIAVFVGVNQLQLRHIAHQNRENGQAIRDCTTPAHACYERGQAQTGVALTHLVVAFCHGLHPHDSVAARACEVAALKGLQ